MSTIKLYYDLGQVTKPVQKTEILPLSTDFSSLFAVNMSGDPINFSYSPEKKIDMMIYRRKCQIKKGTEVTTGFCLHLDDRQIILEREDSSELMMINNYDDVVFDTTVLRPGIVTFSSPGIATYLDNNLRWEARIKAEIQGNRCRLSLFADVSNLSEEPYRGTVFVFPRRYRRSADRSLSKAVLAPEVESFSISHINGYQIATDEIKGLNSFFLLRTTISPLKLVYCYHLQDRTLTTRFQGNSPDSLPEAKIYLYQDDFFMGEQFFPETSQGGMIFFPTGPSAALQIDNFQTESKKDNLTLQTYLLTISNPHDEAKNLLLFSRQGWSNVNIPPTAVEKSDVYWETVIQPQTRKEIKIVLTYPNRD